MVWTLPKFLSEKDAKTSTDERASGGVLVQADDVRPQRLYVVVIKSRPFLPAQAMPVVLDSELWEETIDRVMNTPHRMLALFYVPDFKPSRGRLNPSILPLTGTLVRVHQVQKHDTELQFVAEGIERIQVAQWLNRKNPYLMEAHYPQPNTEPADELKAYGMAVIAELKELVPSNPLYGEELKQYLQRFSPNEPGPLADIAAVLTTAPGEELQAVLDEINLLPRLQRVLPMLKKEIEVVRLQNQLQAEVKNSMDQHQREFFLREQLKAIQKELGIVKDDRSSDADLFRSRLEHKHLTREARQRIIEELEKLTVLQPGSPEYGVARNYLDWATQVPWGVYSQDQLNVKRARQILDRDHEGLQEVKDRILEFIGLGAFRGTVAGTIILLVGPPGVGKTSIGQSVAEALGRRFYRFSVGGMRDEAEIKGHRRTYVGAMPGKFVQALKHVGVMNPVILLDEIDKIGASYQGDPASALLETLDPEQNSAFLDHYLDVPLDLSQVVFIATANTLDTIPAPLLDRMEVIRLAGYLTEEKMVIARKHLWGRQLAKLRIMRSDLNITPTALRQVIEGYAREAGVRTLDKLLQRIIRKTVMRMVEDPKLKRVSIKPADLPQLLGEPQFKPEPPMVGIGVVTGLAWTALGGATLSIEATQVPAKERGLKLTGQLGDVMQESAQIAHSYVSGQVEEFGIDPQFFQQAHIHLHVPEGATPKDGPSAGITMASALISLALGQAPMANVAMTGELTLTGQVFAIGGVREKVLAARRRHITTLILPSANQADFKALPEYLKEGLEVHFVGHYREVFPLLFKGARVDQSVRPNKRLSK